MLLSVLSEVMLHRVQLQEQQLEAQLALRLELLPAGTFKDRHTLESAAAALTKEAHAAGLQRIDSVVPSPNGERLFAVQGTIGDPAANRVAVETRAASEQSLALSSGAVQGAPNVLHQQQETQQEQARQAQKAMGV